MATRSSPVLSSVPVLHRHPANPILKPADAPFPGSLLFNAGVARFNGRYVMLFRNDFLEPGQPHHTNLGLAHSDDGIRWTIESKPVWQWNDDEVRRVYDPRITVIDGRAYVCFAMDTRHGLRGGIAATEDFHRFDVLSLSAPDNRNMVLFPERVGGNFVRLERPMPGYSGRNLYDAWLSESPDLCFWGRTRLVLDVEAVPYANNKIGPAAPPVRTRRGWLTTLHTMDLDPGRGKNGWEPAWQKRYCAGLALLDLEDPSKVIGLLRRPLLAPEAPYETDGGFRNDVIFPGGMILEESGEVKIYYGAADTVECLATAHVDDLLNLFD